ncbi:hypothetical protein ACFL51_00830 [Myxococcota bacterium]
MASNDLNGDEGRAVAVSGILVEIGAVTFQDEVVQAEVSNALNDMPTASFSLSASALDCCPVDFLTPVSIYSIEGERKDQLFVGLVDAVVNDGRSVDFRLVASLQYLQESRTLGIGFSAETPPLEMIWFVARGAGIPPDRIKIQGFAPGPRELFEVVVPLVGANTRHPLRFGRVLITPGMAFRDCAEGLEPDEVREDFESSSLWAVTYVEADTLHEAESIGVSRVEVAVAWLQLRSQYSYSELADWPLARFSRASTLSLIDRKSIVAVRGIASKRRCINNTDRAFDRAVLGLPDDADMRQSDYPPNLPAQIEQAVLSWRRARDAENPIEQVTALWESVEFLVSRVRLEPLFSKAERKKLKRLKPEGLNDLQRKRFTSQMDRLNDTPLRTRLRELLRLEGVPFAEGELDILWTVRGFRNDFVHGRALSNPPVDELRQSVAFVARMLAFKLQNMRYGSASRTSSTKGSFADVTRAVIEGS